jgi:hypothetical protein
MVTVGHLRARRTAYVLGSNVQFIACPSDPEESKLHHYDWGDKDHRSGNYVTSAGDWCPKFEYNNNVADTVLRRVGVWDALGSCNGGEANAIP